MRRTAVIHIGLEKTGSTAIQRWLADQDQLLRLRGVLIPRTIGYQNHTKLVAACLDDGVLDNLKHYHQHQTGLSEQQFRARVFSDLKWEIQAASPTWRTLLITSELISSRLSTPTEIRRLLDQVQPHVDHVEFVLFLRRQDQLALSRFSSLLRSGYAEFSSLFADHSPFHFLQLPDQRRISDNHFFYDFEAITDRFRDLPASSLKVYCYDTCNPIEVIARRLEVETPPEHLQTRRINPAMSAAAQYILSQLNQHKPVQFSSGMRNEAYRRLQRRIETEVSGAPRTVSRQSAIDFLAQYAAINQRIVSQFGTMERGFSSDFSRYPDVADYSWLPELVSPQLNHYQALAARIPTREPMGQTLLHQARRAGGSLKRRLQGRPC